jgi:hypothetical protein
MNGDVCIDPEGGPGVTTAPGSELFGDGGALQRRHAVAVRRIGPGHQPSRVDIIGPADPPSTVATGPLRFRTLH